MKYLLILSFLIPSLAFAETHIDAKFKYPPDKKAEEAAPGEHGTETEQEEKSLKKKQELQSMQDELDRMEEEHMDEETEGRW